MLKVRYIESRKVNLTIFPIEAVTFDFSKYKDEFNEWVSWVARVARVVRVGGKNHKEIPIV